MPDIYVPDHHVGAVYVLLGTLMSEEAPSSAAAGPASAVTAPGTTDGPLRVFADRHRVGPNGHAVLDALAEAAPEWISFSELMARTGVSRGEVNGGFTSIGRVASTSKPAKPHEADWRDTEYWYRIDPETAELWLCIRRERPDVDESGDGVLEVRSWPP
jgi:hypothetical protein